jgi:predicted amidohydrolase
MRVHVVQVAYGDGEPVADRVTRVADLVRAQHGADLVVLPELWAPGGFNYRQWRERAETVTGPTVSAIASAAADIGAVVHSGSIVERLPDGGSPLGPGPTGSRLWNTSVLLGPDGTVLATYRKIHRFGFGEGERVLMQAGEQIVTVALPPPSGVPEPVPAGLATCYDLRFPELFRRLLDTGMQLLIVPAAWPAARVEHWRLLGRARAIENQVAVIACNTGGCHGGVEMGGHSQVVGPAGEVLAEAGTGEEVLTVNLDLSQVATWRRRFPVLADRRL